MKFNFQKVQGGVLAAKGFLAAGGVCGIKESGSPDLGLLFAPQGALCFGAFTRNALCAAPVTLSRSRLVQNGFVRGVVVNSGNANACTGTQGAEDALRMATLTETETGQAEGSFLVCSTGKIGTPLPMDCIEKGIKAQCLRLEQGTGREFSEAILTTDTCVKEVALEVKLEQGSIFIGGCSKGAGMIHPDMATMLAFVTTDLQLSDDFKGEYLEIINESFNAITVDGDTSTNDTSLFFSSGASGISYQSLSLSEKGRVRQAIGEVFAELAKAIVRDGEGATKFVEIRVTNARTRQEARQMGRFVANSKLVKTALFGQDPNWGRIVSAAATCGVVIDPMNLVLRFGELEVFAKGQPLKVNIDELNKIFAEPEILVILDLGLGEAEASTWTCDLSYEYVKINAEYHT